MELEEQVKKEIIDKYGSIRQFALAIDIPHTTIDSILKRGMDNSNVNNVLRICKALNISADDSIEQKHIIYNLNFDNAEPVEIPSHFIKIPVLGTIKAGTPVEAQEDIIEYVNIPKDWPKGNKKYYGLRISGDSMYPEYQENDIVIFQYVEDMLSANGEDCAVMVNGDDATFKNVRITQSGIMLTPLNINNTDGYEPKFYDSEDIQNLPVKIIGIAKEVRRKKGNKQ